METIQIALASDANYFPGLLVTTVSLARHASRGVALDFHVLDGGIGAANLDFLRRKLEEAHPRISLRMHSVDTAAFTEFPEWTGGSRMTYVRLMLPSLLKDLGFVLYCDVDFFWTADVAELWALRDDSRTLCACTDGWQTTVERERSWYDSRGISVDMSRYVCAGLLLMNLDRFREENLVQRLMAFLRTYRDVQFVDQTAINAVVTDIGLLPRKWGRFSREISARELGGAWAIHYAGGAPWCSTWWTSLISPADLLWYRHYGELTGLSARAARRKFLSGREYAKRRLAWWLVKLPVVRALFFGLLRLTDRGVYVPYLIGKRI